MRFSWDEPKRSLNLRQHGLDFVDAPTVFEGPTFTYEDDRFAYTKERFVTLDVLRGIVVSVVHTETSRKIRVISFRKATKHEQAIFFRNVQDRLGAHSEHARSRHCDLGGAPRSLDQAHRSWHRPARTEACSTKGIHLATPGR